MSKGRKQQSAVPAASSKWPKIIQLVQKLAAFSPAACLQDDRLTTAFDVISSLCSIRMTKGHTHNDNRLIGALQLPQLLGKLLDARQQPSDWQLPSYRDKVHTCLSAALMTAQLALTYPVVGTEQLPYFAELARNLRDSAVLPKVATAMQELAEALIQKQKQQQQQQQQHLWNCELLVETTLLWWWQTADSACLQAGADSGAAVEAAGLAAAQLSLAVAQYAAAAIKAGCLQGAAAPYLRPPLAVASKLMNHPCIDPNSLTPAQHVLYSSPAFLKLMVAMLVLDCRRLRAFAGVAPPLGDSMTHSSSSSSSSSNSSSSGVSSDASSSNTSHHCIPLSSMAAISSSNGRRSLSLGSSTAEAPIDTTPLLAALEAHEQQLWQNVGLAAEAFDCFAGELNAVVNEQCTGACSAALLTATYPFADAAKRVAISISTISGAARPQNPLFGTRLPKQHVEVLRAVVWELPGLLLTSAACLCFHSSRPVIVEMLVKAAEFAAEEWRVVSTVDPNHNLLAWSRLRPGTATEGLKLALREAAVRARPVTSEQEQQQQHQQRLVTGLLQAWSLNMQQQLTSSLCSRSCSSSRGSSGSSTKQSPSTGSPQLDAVGDLLLILQHISYGRCWSSTLAAWHDHAAQVLSLLEVYTRVVVHRITSRSCHATAGTQQQQQQHSQQQSVADQALFRQLGRSLSCLLSVTAWVPTPLLQSAVTAAAGDATQQHLFALLTSFLKLHHDIWQGPDYYIGNSLKEILGTMICGVKPAAIRGLPCPSANLAQQQVVEAAWVVLAGRMSMMLALSFDLQVYGSTGRMIEARDCDGATEVLDNINSMLSLSTTLYKLVLSVLESWLGKDDGAQQPEAPLQQQQQQQQPQQEQQPQEKQQPLLLQQQQQPAACSAECGGSSSCSAASSPAPGSPMHRDMCSKLIMQLNSALEHFGSAASLTSYAYGVVEEMGCSSRVANSGDSDGSNGSEAEAEQPCDKEEASIQAAQTPRQCVHLVLASGRLLCLQELLRTTGAAVCTALPVPWLCNNPCCNNMAYGSELVLVGGKSTMCAGCRLARYCGSVCQTAHWQEHRPVCRWLAARAAGVQKSSKPPRTAS